MMMRKIFGILALAVAMMNARGTQAQQPEKGYWRAASGTAASITGDIAISGSKLSIDFGVIPFSPVRGLKPEEVSAVFDEAIDSAGPGSLYRVNVPAARRFLHHNTLCGTADTTWMATYVKGKTLEITFFSGEDPPVMKFEVLQNATNVCGTYTYVR
jgi:hypothetical protein